MMVDYIAPCFWGQSDQDRFYEELKSFVSNNNLKDVFAGDDLITINRNLGFLEDSNFRSAHRSVIHNTNKVGNAIIWRFWIHCWSASNGLRRKGDFVECGVASGASSLIMAKYINLEKTSKLLYLYDAWDTDYRIDQSAYGKNLDYVRSSFAPYKNTVIVPGYLPDTLATSSPSEICFLHIDLNNGPSEIAVLEELFDRVSDGGIVLFDDFGGTGYRESQDLEVSWASSRGYIIAELPTGQGLLIK